MFRYKWQRYDEFFSLVTRHKSAMAAAGTGTVFVITADDYPRTYHWERITESVGA